MNRALATTDQPQQQLAPAIAERLSVTEIRNRKDQITLLMREAMQEGQHYGSIPGTDGKTLLKPGAEMLGMMFRLAPHFRVDCKELDNGHREYSVECTLTALDGTTAAVGLGSCSTLESKYRWRWSQRRCPSCGAEAIRPKRGNGFFCGAKLGGCGKNFGGQEAAAIERQRIKRVENPDIADQYNTCLKMGVKRAHVAAILLATSASDMFAQEEEAPRDLHVDDEPEHQDDVPAAPAVAPTAKQELAQQCALLASRLQRDRESIAELLTERGGWAPKERWTDLTEGELRKAREILAEEVELAGGGA